MSVFDILADYRSFCEPRLALAARFRLIHPRYCSLDVRGDRGRTYHIVARPLAGDPSVLREVFIRQGYGAVLSFLPSGRPLSQRDRSQLRFRGSRTRTRSANAARAPVGARRLARRCAIPGGLPGNAIVHVPRPHRPQ